MATYKEPMQKRLPAVKLRVRDVLESAYVREEGWSPNYIIVNNVKVGRVNIIATIVGTSTDSTECIIDDGSGKVRLRSFEQEKSSILSQGIGSVVLVIGRPREFSTERYIVPEIVRKIDDLGWVKLRNLEIKQSTDNNNNFVIVEKAKPETLVQMEKLENEEIIEEEILSKEAVSSVIKRDEIYQMIKDLDKGDGVGIEFLLEKYPKINIERAIQNLLEEGEIFEIKPGRLKILA